MEDLQRNYSEQTDEKKKVEDELEQLKFQNVRNEERLVSQDKLLNTLEEKSIK